MMEKELNRIGEMLNQFYTMELMIDGLLKAFFKPEKETEFLKFMLNSSVVAYGGKIKLLSNIINVDDRILNGMRELGNIRNGIAHVAPYLDLTNADNPCF